MDSPINKNQLIERSVQDWLHNEYVSLNDCIDANIEVMFLNGQHIPCVTEQEVKELESKYAEELI
ncbi:MAG: hypothetical protein HQL46_14700 [Gammaproteobacteria bacterium]|nr:hypothetical protein [Gammaproteobacteria bacterium]